MRKWELDSMNYRLYPKAVLLSLLAQRK